jgi:hypothetical protein
MAHCPFWAIPLKVLCCFSLLLWQTLMGVESINEIPVHFPRATVLIKIAKGIIAFF